MYETVSKVENSVSKKGQKTGRIDQTKSFNKISLICPFCQPEHFLLLCYLSICLGMYLTIFGKYFFSFYVMREKGESVYYLKGEKGEGAFWPKRNWSIQGVQITTVFFKGILLPQKWFDFKNFSTAKSAMNLILCGCYS